MKLLRTIASVILLTVVLSFATPAYASTFDLTSFVTIYNRLVSFLDFSSSSQLSQVVFTLSNGLVGYWPFDEGSGTTVSDASGSGNGGTLTSGPTWTTGKVGSTALNFNGTSYVNIFSAANLTFSRNVAVSAWIRPTFTDSGTNHAFVEKSGEYSLLTRSGLIAFSAGNSTIYANGAYTVGQWYHVVGMVDSNGTISLYINGTLQNGGINGPSTGISITGTSNPLTIGKNFIGDVDDVHIYNRALTTSEITSLSGGASTDISGTNSTNTTDTGSTNTQTPPPAGTYTLSVSVSGNGSVTSNTGGISCGSSCTASIQAGGGVNLTATAAAGSQFNGWSGACGGTQNTCTVTLNAAANVTATFITTVSGPRTWYVDSAANGSIHDGTSWANAWTNLDQVVGVGPGDTIYISGGSSSQTYYINSWHIVGSGSDMAHRVTYKVGQDAGHNGVVILDGSHKAPPVEGHAIILDTNYVVISGEYNGEQHLKLQNYWGNGVLNLPNLRGIKLEYIDLGDRNIGLTEVFTQFEISHVHVKAKPGSDHAINISGATGSTWGVNSLHDSVIEVGSTQDALTGLGDDGIKWGAAIDIYNNTIRSFYTPDPGHQHQDGLQAAGRYMRVYNNYFENLGNSAIFVDFFLAGELRDIWIYNNVIVQTRGALIGTVARPIETTCEEACPVIDDIKIFNNTLVDSSMTAINMQVRPTGTIPVISNVEVRNNLIVDTGSGGAAIDAYSSLRGANSNFTADKVTGVTLSNNLIETGIQGRNGIYPTQTNGASWQTGSEQFTWYVPFSSGNDFHLRSTDTSARGGGVNLSSYTTIDKDGLSRPSSGVWDIGAYSFAQNSNCTAPSAFFTASPNSGYDPLAVSFDASGSSACSGSLTYSWNFGDNSAVLSGSAVAHTFRSGTYTIVLTVRNTSGQTSSISRQITILPAAVPNMVLGVNFDNSIVDWSGKNSTTAWSGASCFTTGLINQAGCFSGFNVVQVSNNALVEGMNQFTFSGWAKKSTAATVGGIGGKFTVYNLMVNGQGLTASIGTANGGGTLTAVSNVNADTNWHHYAVTYDGTTASLYLDGVKVKQQAMSGKVLTNPQQYFYIGAQPFGTFFKGSLDDVRVYDRALSDTEMTALFNDRSASSDTPAAPVTPPVVVVPPADTTLPLISITSPSRNSTISGTVSLVAAASDNVGIANVQFKLDGQNLGTALSVAPYSGNWNTAGVSNGQHSLTAVALDLSGNVATSAAVPVTVQNSVPVIVQNVPTPSPTPVPTLIVTPPVGGTVTPPVTGGNTAGAGVGTGAGAGAGAGTPSIPVTPTVPTTVVPSVLPVTGVFTPTVAQPALTPFVPLAPKATYHFTRNLKLGMTHTDVKELQKYLNTHGFTVATKGSGSLGNETTYFGPATYKAVIKFQEANRAAILTPYKLIKGTGFVGPSTLKVLNQASVGVSSPSTIGTPAISSSVFDLINLLKALLGK